MYGSCLPKKSESFRKDASFIINLKTDFLSNLSLIMASADFSSYTTGGYAHIYCVIILTSPVLVPFLSFKTKVCLTVSDEIIKFIDLLNIRASPCSIMVQENNN